MCLDMKSFLQAYKLQILKLSYKPNIVILGFGQICDVIQKANKSKNGVEYTYFWKQEGNKTEN